jgi:hypothetical protein
LTDNTKLGWRGALFASQYVLGGCILFFLIEDFTRLQVDLSYANITISLAIIACLLSLPFSIVGGYILGRFLQKAQWNKHDYPKAIVSGIVIASISIVIIFIVGGYFQACLTSHGQCSEAGYMKQLFINELESNLVSPPARVFMSRFLLALPIAVTGGGLTAWRLIRSAL